MRFTAKNEKSFDICNRVCNIVSVACECNEVKRRDQNKKPKRTNMKTAEEIKRPDYEVARDEGRALFDTFKLTVLKSQPSAAVEDGWPHILYSLTFGNGKQAVTLPYKLGVGHVDWSKQPNRSGSGEIDSALFTLRKNPHAQLSDKLLQARAAAFLATVQRVYPESFEVLGRYAQEGLEATEQTFEQWADNLGFDTDSRKAERIYHASREHFGDVVALIGIANVRTLANIVSRL